MEITFRTWVEVYARRYKNFLLLGAIILFVIWFPSWIGNTGLLSNCEKIDPTTCLFWYVPLTTWMEHGIVILVAFISFTLAYIDQEKSKKRRRTLDILYAVIEQRGPTFEANLNFAIWINEEIVLLDDHVDKEVDKVIITMLDFYDLISDTAIRGVIDKEMIIVHLGGRMRSAYDLMKNYIDRRRVSLGRPNLYSRFQIFVEIYIKNRKV